MSASPPLRWAVDAGRWAPSSAQLELLLSALPADEVVRAARFVEPADVKRCLLSQLLQRAAGARALGAAWGAPLRRTRGGKPFLPPPPGAPRPAGAPNFNYNVSHEGAWVVLAAEGRCLVGVDVAAPRQLRGRGGRGLAASLELMRAQLSDAEWARLQSLAGDEAAMEAAFQQMWCVKEAFIKARGDGVAFEPLSRVEAVLPPDAGAGGGAAQPPVRRGALLVDGQPAPRWRVFLQQLPGRHWVAVARGPPDAAVDAHGEFRATLQEPVMPEPELQAHLDAHSPAFDLLTVEDLLPDELLQRYLDCEL
ncbi:Aasdhppt [Scenedesmus sp. PABB004]|nr:Aasdhppt [Scenedesmus sp. PABB004]